MTNRTAASPSHTPFVRDLRDHPTPQGAPSLALFARVGSQAKPRAPRIRNYRGGRSDVAAFQSVGHARRPTLPKPKGGAPSGGIGHRLTLRGRLIRFVCGDSGSQWLHRAGGPPSHDESNGGLAESYSLRSRPPRPSHAAGCPSPCAVCKGGVSGKHHEQHTSELRWIDVGAE